MGRIAKVNFVNGGVQNEMESTITEVLENDTVFQAILKHAPSENLRVQFMIVCALLEQKQTELINLDFACGVLAKKKELLEERITKITDCKNVNSKMTIM